jgi:signal transduction histidine kinase
VILAAHTFPNRSSRASRARRALTRLRGLLRRGRDGGPSTEDALLRAMCHDMHGSLSCLQGALHHLSRGQSPRAEVLSLAQSQVEQLASMLRTAEATGGAVRVRSGTGQPIADVVAASLAASGLPRRQLTVVLSSSVDDVLVGDARLQRILVNLLENAHRHGDGAPVVLDAVRSPGWVQLSLTQSGLAPGRLVDHLSARRPPAGVTGLGLWSVQRQTRELGGQVLWDDDGAALTLRLLLPDR